MDFVSLLMILIVIVVLPAGAAIALAQSLSLEKRRKTKESKQLQKDEQARALKAERQAEEKKKLEEAAQLEEDKEREQADLTTFGQPKSIVALETQMTLWDEARLDPGAASVTVAVEPATETSSTSRTNWIRKIWPHEAKDFTPWLGENLHLVSECTGLDLHELGQEVSAAGGRADIVAWEAKSKNKAVIENQLDPANARHFQQLISYGESLKARIRIWLAPSFGNKFRRLISEQNEKGKSSPDSAIYYLVKITHDKNDRIIFSLDMRPTQLQIDHVFLTESEQKTRQRLIEEFWRWWGRRSGTSFEIDKYERGHIVSRVDMGEARIIVTVWCFKGAKRNERIRAMRNYAKRLSSVFPETDTCAEWGYDETRRILLELTKPIRLKDVAEWKKIREWFSEMERKIKGAAYREFVADDAGPTARSV